MLDFTAIDFETANSYRGSPCSVGLVKVRDGVAVGEAHWLMRPPEGVDSFDVMNVSVHGITSSMVADQPRWRKRLPEIVDFIDGDVVVGHNAAFDIGVVRYACAADNLQWPDMRFLCSLILARKALRLPVYGLPFVADTLGVAFENHHDALADAQAVAGVIAKLALQHGATSIDDLAASVGVHLGQMSAGGYEGSGARSEGGRLSQPGLDPDADPGGYLYGRVVVFTGALTSMTRQIAWDHCARIGALAEPTVTKRTNVLVIGDINPGSLRVGAVLTSKAEKAFQYQAKGQAIEVMAEADFLRCIDGTDVDRISIVLDR